MLTFGANAAFGSIAQPDKHPLRLTVRDGVSWLVETDTAKLADVIGKMTSKPDFLLASKPRRSGHVAQGAAAMPSGATTQAATVPETHWSMWSWATRPALRRPTAATAAR